MFSHLQSVIRQSKTLSVKVRYFFGLTCMLLVCGVFTFDAPRAAMHSYSDYTYSHRHGEMLLFRTENSQLRAYSRESELDLAETAMLDFALLVDEQYVLINLSFSRYCISSVNSAELTLLLDANPVRAGPEASA